ncbi:MAG: hypothetical protein AAF653_02080, partial [Chloroflexota bacterium]
MTVQPAFPYSLREINSLPEAQQTAIYRTLLPESIYEYFDIDPVTGVANGHRVVQYRTHQGSRAVEVIVRRDIHDRDPALYQYLIIECINHVQVESR